MQYKLSFLYNKIIFSISNNPNWTYFIFITICIILKDIHCQSFYSFCVGSEIIEPNEIREITVLEIQELAATMNIFKNSELNLDVLRSLVESFGNLAKSAPTQDTALMALETSFERFLVKDSLQSLFSQFNSKHIFVMENSSSLGDSQVDANSIAFTKIEGRLTAPARLTDASSSVPVNLVQSKNSAPGNLQFETLKSLQAVDLSDGISVCTYNTTGGFSRPSSPDAKFCVDKFSEEFFIFKQVACAMGESKKYSGSMDQIAVAFNKGFQFLENDSNLTDKEKLLILTQFTAANKDIIFILPNGNELNITPYAVELFSAYRKNFYSTPGGHGLALRGGLNALSTINWVGSLNLPDSSIPPIIKVSNTFIYNQLMSLAEKVRPNQ